MLDQRIAELRKLHGLSQAELAKRIHTSANTVSSYECGRRSPDLSVLIALAQEFGLTTDYLLTGVPSSERDINTAKELLVKQLQKSGFMHTVLLSECPDKQELLELLLRTIIGVSKTVV